MSGESDEAAFTRIEYIALTHLHLTLAEIEVLRFGHLLDLIECWRQEQGIVKPRRRAVSIDEVIPIGV